jgi:hypothetical protein
MALSRIQVPRPASGGQPVSFRFPVTWTYLAAPLGSFKVEEKPVRRPVPGPPPSPPPESPTETAVLAVMPPVRAAQDLTANPRSTDSWEMVIPKTGRPNARSSRNPPSSPVKSIPEIPPGPTVVEAPKMESTVDLGLKSFGAFTAGALPKESRDRLLLSVKSALATLLVLAIAGILFYPSTDRQPAQAPVAAEMVEVGPSLPVGLGGWIADFAPLGGSHGPRRISVLRGSQKLTDFRLEFSGQIENKALAWVFRAKDPKNFYVMKLEIIKPLPQSTGILTHFAVINGQEQARVQVPLSMPLRPNIPYTVRLDALGSSFTTWIQGQKVDQWTDLQIREGGVGIYSEQTERGTLSGDMAVFTLLAKSQSGR